MKFSKKRKRFSEAETAEPDFYDVVKKSFQASKLGKLSDEILKPAEDFKNSRDQKFLIDLIQDKTSKNSVDLGSVKVQDGVEFSVKIEKSAPDPRRSRDRNDIDFKIVFAQNAESYLLITSTYEITRSGVIPVVYVNVSERLRVLERRLKNDNPQQHANWLASFPKIFERASETFLPKLQKVKGLVDAELADRKALRDRADQEERDAAHGLPIVSERIRSKLKESKKISRLKRLIEKKEEEQPNNDLLLAPQLLTQAFKTGRLGEFAQDVMRYASIHGIAFYMLHENMRYSGKPTLFKVDDHTSIELNTHSVEGVQAAAAAAGLREARGQPQIDGVEKKAPPRINVITLRMSLVADNGIVVGSKLSMSDHASSDMEAKFELLPLEEKSMKALDHIRRNERKEYNKLTNNIARALSQKENEIKNWLHSLQTSLQKLSDQSEEDGAKILDGARAAPALTESARIHLIRRKLARIL